LQFVCEFAICDFVMTSHPRLNRIKRSLAARGWTQQAAANEAGVTFEHLNRVLNGHRISERLLDKLQSLPAREVAGVR